MRADLSTSSRHETPRSAGSSRRARRLAVFGAVIVLCLAVGVAVGALTSAGDEPRSGAQPPGTGRHMTPDDPLRRWSTARPIRAFEANSWWNSPVPDNAPHNPNETGILDYLRTSPRQWRRLPAPGRRASEPLGGPGLLGSSRRHAVRRHRRDDTGARPSSPRCGSRRARDPRTTPTAPCRSSTASSRLRHAPDRRPVRRLERPLVGERGVGHLPELERARRPNRSVR